MPKVLLDACVPHSLRHFLQAATVETAFYAGLDQLNDSELLDVIDGQFDVLVTLDRNLMYQQRIAGRGLAIIVLRVSTQTPDAFRILVPKINEALKNTIPGQFTVVGP